ncbi:hypothetical protein EJB05_10575, partial [Eragrostis curvula]
MAIKSLLLVLVTLCFFQMLAVTAQGTSEDSNYAIIANGTVTCSGNSSADLEAIVAWVSLHGEEAGRSYTDSNGKFIIKISKRKPLRFLSPKYATIHIHPFDFNKESCPSGFKVEAYIKVNLGSNPGDKTTVLYSVHILPNGDREYFQEHIRNN